MEWRRIHNEELHDLYSPNIIRVIRRMRWAGHVARVGDRRGTYRVIERRPDGKTSLGRRRRSLKYNIKIDLTEVG